MPLAILLAGWLSCATDLLPSPAHAGDGSEPDLVTVPSGRRPVMRVEGTVVHATVEREDPPRLPTDVLRDLDSAAVRALFSEPPLQGLGFSLGAHDLQVLGMGSSTGSRS